MEAIKPNELRLGNWIASGQEFKDTSVIGKVRSIGNEDCEFEQIEVETEEAFEWFFAGDYCGIPLTEEILLKAGFVKSHLTKEENQIFRKTWTEGYFDLEEIISFYFGGNQYSIEVKTVHQLQNLYYYFTNQELNIQL